MSTLIRKKTVNELRAVWDRGARTSPSNVKSSSTVMPAHNAISQFKSVIFSKNIAKKLAYVRRYKN